MTMHLGDRVVRVRERAGLSQRSLADRAGISQPTLSRIENGAREPKMNEVLAVATGSSVRATNDRAIHRRLRPRAQLPCHPTRAHLVHATGGHISAPETVRREVFRKAKPNSKFAAAAAVWARLELAKRLTVLSDDLTPALEAVVQRLSNTPMIDRMAVSKDLGEELVIAHAVVQAEAGNDVVMLIDEIR